MGFGKRLFMFFLIILLLGLLSVYWPKLTGNTTGSSFDDNENLRFVKEPAFVTGVVDGDTIHVRINGSDSEETVRLLGVNTPEKGKAFYSEAKNFLIETIENRDIEILRDSEDKDRYGRKLRYVFYNNDLINTEILQQGLATSFMIEGLFYENKIKNTEEYARKNGVGLWEKSTEACASCIVLDKLDPVQEFFIIKNTCNFECNLSGWIVKDDANHFFYLNDVLAFEESKYDSKTEIWNDAGDRFFMRDKEGMLVVFYEY